MKKIFSLVAIIAIILASNCSRIPENNDPVIGIWSSLNTVTTSDKGTVSTRFEWIFNDVYLGRYHVIEDGTIVAKTDFKWTEDDSTYTISYPGMDKEDDVVTMKDSPKGIMLEKVNGNVLATRE